MFKRCLWITSRTQACLPCVSVRINNVFLNNVHLPLSESYLARDDHTTKDQSFSVFQVKYPLSTTRLNQGKKSGVSHRQPGAYLICWPRKSCLRMAEERLGVLGLGLPVNAEPSDRWKSSLERRPWFLYRAEERLGFWPGMSRAPSGSLYEALRMFGFSVRAWQGGLRKDRELDAVNWLPYQNFPPKTLPLPWLHSPIAMTLEDFSVDRLLKTFNKK